MTKLSKEARIVKDELMRRIHERPADQQVFDFSIDRRGVVMVRDVAIGDAEPMQPPNWKDSWTVAYPTFYRRKGWVTLSTAMHAVGFCDIPLRLLTDAG